jgi:hypothetical protein
MELPGPAQYDKDCQILVDDLNRTHQPVIALVPWLQRWR